jgi:hypothetical protein
MGVPLGLSFCNSIPTLVQHYQSLHIRGWLSLIHVAVGHVAGHQFLLNGCHIWGYFWKSLAWCAGSPFHVSCKSLIECISPYFLCKRKSKKHNKTVNLIWWKYSAYPSNFSLCNTPHPDPNTHIHSHLLDRNELVVFQSHNINTHVSFLCLVDTNLLSPHTCFLHCSKTCRWWCTTPFHFLYPSAPLFLSFCHILVSQSQNLVSEYRSSFTVQSSASKGLLNSQSGSEGSKLLVDPFKHCCFSSCHTLLSIKFPLLSCPACICPFALTM